MNIEEIKDYINSKKDKIKSGAIKATSTALVAGMLLSGSMGLTFIPALPSSYICN